VPNTPRSPGATRSALRRSSTSRSIGNHTIYSPSDTGSIAPDEGGDGAAARRGSTAVSDGDEAFGREERLAKDRERERERSEADSHVEKYIGDQLNRIKTDDSGSVAVYEDEFEAQLD
jgi:hypothetical protein